MSVPVQSFFKDQLMGCRSNGMQLPQGIDPQYGIPPELIVWADTRSEYVGDTLQRAYDTGGKYFKRTPLIIFVILPERGEIATLLCAPCMQLMHKSHHPLKGFRTHEASTSARSVRHDK